MFAETLVTGLNSLYLVLMGIISVVGSATMIKLASILLQKEPRRQPTQVDFSVEDA
jgi:hypothetical protein